MEEKLKFIEGGFPLVNRIWLEVDENLTKSMAEEFINEQLRSIQDTFALEVNLYVDSASELSNNNLIEILENIHQFKVGYEKSYPIVSVYYPCGGIDDEILSRINECDKHRPGIRMYILTREKDLPSNNSLVSMRKLAEELFDKLEKSQKIGLDSTLYFFNEKDTEKLEQFFDLRRLVYTWDTSVNMKKPLIQVSPNIPIEKNLVEKISKYILKDNESINILDSMCGLTSLLMRYKENKTVPTEYVPLGGCGAGVSERKLCGNGSTPSCFFSSGTSMKSDAYSKCKECVHVSSCTGCLLMCTDFDECNIKNAFDLYIASV